MWTYWCTEYTYRQMDSTAVRSPGPDHLDSCVYSAQESVYGLEKHSQAWTLFESNLPPPKKVSDDRVIPQGDNVSPTMMQDRLGLIDGLLTRRVTIVTLILDTSLTAHVDMFSSRLLG